MPSSQMYSVESTFLKPSEQAEAYTRERQQYWEDYARSASKWVSLRSYYQFRLAEIYKLSVPPGMRMLKLGCGDYRQVIKGTNIFRFTCPGIV